MIKQIFKLFITVLLSLILNQTSFAAGDTLRLVCVGNSITEGYGTNNPASDSYPTQLSRLLGSKWLVKNSGVSGRTMLKHGDFPIWNEKKFKEGLAFKPDVVTIMLGTNDSKPYNWIHKDEFIKDYKSMIDTFRTLPSRPVIWLCIPIPSFSDAFDIRDSVINADIIPMIKQIAKEKKCRTIDFNTLMKKYPKLVPDGIHPNKEGSAVMAEYLYSVLTGKKKIPHHRNK